METYRVSSYLIPVRLEKDPDKYVIIQGYTGAFDVISSSIHTFLRSTPYFTAENFPFSRNIFDQLEQRGYITSSSKEKESAFVHKLAHLLHERNKKLTKYFMFLVSYDCNFRCPYCFENCISQNGHQWSKKVFTKQMVDKAYEAMFQIEQKSELHFKKIMLSGGEPLLSENKEIITYIVEKGIEKGYKFGAITNGYDLQYFSDLLSPEKINGLQITIDGAKEYHDNRRFHYKEGGSFDVIMENISLALKKDVGVGVRINIDKKNMDSVESLLSVFKEKKFLENEKFKYGVALLTNHQEENESDLQYMNQKDLQKELKGKDYSFSCNDYGTTSKIFESIKNKKPIPINPTFCNAQSSEYVFDPYGNIYSCMSFVGQTSQIIGNYRNEKILWTSKKADWHDRDISSAPNCQQCRYAFFCGGGCLVFASQKEGKFDMSYCNNYPSIFKQAVNKAYSQYSTM